MFLDVEMHNIKYSPANVIACVERRRKVWFPFLEAKRQTERYD